MDCEGPNTSYSGVTYTTCQVVDLLDMDMGELMITSSSDSESEYDLSDPEAEVMSAALSDVELELSYDSDSMSAQADVSSHNSSDNDSTVESSLETSHQTRSKSHGRGCSGRGRGSGGRGRGGGGRGRGSGGRGRDIRGHARSKRGFGSGSKSQGKGRRGGRQSKGGTKGEKGRLADDFDIHDLTTIDNDVPSLHTFNPSRSPGVHLPMHSEDWSPEEIFKLYFDSEIIKLICNASNEYAERNKKKYPQMYSYFRKMEPHDFYNLVGILVHLGYRKIPRARLMWSPTSLCYDPLISKVMSRNRFDSLLTFLHLVDEGTEKSLQNDGDKLLKVRPLNNHLQQKCMQLYQPNREVSIDERMVRSKARFSFRQYIRNKPTKWGFKLWCLCDSRNGYTSAFSVYRGKHGEVRSGNGLSYDVVVSLMEPYSLQGYSLYIDNFYTSPTLVTYLYKNGIHCTGTLDCTRTGVPSQVHHLKKDLAKKSVPRGKGVYVRDGICAYAVWKDTKCVAVMSSEHPGHSETTVTRNVKQENGQNEKMAVQIPSIVYNYNRFMNGVDRSDQLINYYNLLRQTKKYWKTLFFHYVDIALVNSYIIYKELNPDQSSRMSHYTFRETIVRQLCGIQIAFQQSVAGRKPAAECIHVPVKMDRARDCVYCRIVHKKRRRTIRQCNMCNAPLCWRARTCFKKFHHPEFGERRKSYLSSKCATSISTSAKPKGRPKGTAVKGRGKRRKRNW